MILLCDEDIGTGVPIALTAVGYDARALVRQGWGGMPDVEWLALAGSLGMLVLSCNKKMLLISTERQAIVDAGIGIIFLTTGEERPPRVLLTLLRVWETLEGVDTNEPRPFAKFLSPNGRLSDEYRGLRL